MLKTSSEKTRTLKLRQPCAHASNKGCGLKKQIDEMEDRDGIDNNIFSYLS